MSIFAGTENISALTITAYLRGRVVNVQKAVTGGMVHSPTLVLDGFVTELELQLLMRNKTWFDNVIFHEGGKILNTQELATKSIKFLE